MTVPSMKFNKYQDTVLQEASKTRGKGGHASRSAARHLERALVLEKKMPEVAVFLAITAEEEAAIAVFCALRKRQYQGASQLSDKDHILKASLYPFIQLIGNTIGAIRHQIPLQLLFESKEESPSDKRLIVRMALTGAGFDGPFLEPNPPLNLVSVDEDGNATDYFKAAREIAAERGIDSIHKYTRNLSNIRNKMLYASDSGVPTVENVDESLLPHVEGVFANLAAYLLIEPHSKQNLAQEALSAFIKIRSGLESRET